MWAHILSRTFRRKEVLISSGMVTTDLCAYTILLNYVPALGTVQFYVRQVLVCAQVCDIAHSI
jgi:hypothetical protein